MSRKENEKISFENTVHVASNRALFRHELPKI